MKKGLSPVVLLVIFGLLSVTVIMSTLFVTQQSISPDTVSPSDVDKTTIPILTCDSTTTPTITINTPDLFGGTTVTTKNIIREVGKTSTSNVAGAGTFTASVGTQYEILIGIDSTDDDAEPFGPKIVYTVPCDETPSIEEVVVDDAAATDLTAIAFDPDDNNQIVASDPIDIDAGQVKTIALKWTGSFETDFGNRFCEDNENKKNVLVVRFNDTEYDKAFITDLSGTKLPSAGIQISRVLTAASGYTDLTFEVPVLRSNGDVNLKLVLDADDTVNPTGAASNVTLYLYDVNWFINNDVTPSKWECGIFDEDGTEVGATAADTLLLPVTAD